MVLKVFIGTPHTLNSTDQISIHYLLFHFNLIHITRLFPFYNGLCRKWRINLGSESYFSICNLLKKMDEFLVVTLSKLSFFLFLNKLIAKNKMHTIHTHNTLQHHIMHPTSKLFQLSV